jgi:uncharacterized protein (TIGR03083 family)
MRTQTQTIGALSSCYRQLSDLIDGLGAGDWGVRSLCPDWTVREVVTHLAGVEHALTGWLPASGDEWPPFEKIGAYLEQWAEQPNDDLAADVTGILDTRATELAAMSEEDFALAMMSPVGPASYHRFMEVRVFDFWVHQRDITGPLGIETDDTGLAAEITLDEIERSLGYIVGKKIGLDDGLGIAFHLTGPVQRDLYAAVDGRAAPVGHLDDPTATLTTDSLTFVLLACGRIDPQQVIDDGTITWSGDQEWGEKAARNLAFTR